MRTTPPFGSFSQELPLLCYLHEEDADAPPRNLVEARCWMVQVAKYAQWRCEDAGGVDSSPANLKSSSSPPESSPLSDLKWRPGLSAKEGKARAKELRKYTSERAERRDALRHAKLVVGGSSAERGSSSMHTVVVDVSAAPSAVEERQKCRLLKPSAVLQRALEESFLSTRPEIVSVWLLHADGDACATRWCRQWVRSKACQYGPSCRHLHAFSLAPEVRVSCSRGAAMPPVERAADPAALTHAERKRIAFIALGSRLAFDYEDPEAAARFIARAGRPESCLGAGGALCHEVSDAPAAIPQLPEEVWCSLLAQADVGSLCAVACTCAALSNVLAASGLWAAAAERLFGSERRLRDLGAISGAPSASGSAPSACGSAPSERQLRPVCIESEAALTRWHRVIAPPAPAEASEPAKLPLPGMLAVSLAGELGCSVHAGSMVRLWEVHSGRRIACHQHRGRHALTALAASATHAAVGDASGGVHLYRLEDETFHPSRTLSTAVTNGAAVAAAVKGLLLLPPAGLHHRTLCLTSTLDAVVAHDVDTAQQLWRTRAAHGGVPALARGGGGERAYYAAEDTVAALDVESGAAIWNAPMGEGALFSPDWASATIGHTHGLVGFSDGWQLLGCACGDEAPLWDARCTASMGPVATLRLPRACSGLRQNNSVVGLHLDLGGRGWSGHALLFDVKGAVHLYDIRRVASALAGPPVPEPPHLGRAPKQPPGVLPGACFAADDRRLVIGGGAKSDHARMWTLRAAAGVGAAAGPGTGATEHSGGGSARYAWRRHYAEEQEVLTAEQLGSSSGGEATARTRAKKHSARWTKKQWSH